MCGPTAETVGRDAELPGGARNTTSVPPTAIVSPSQRRRRPVTRSPLTHVPLWERPSSITAQSSPTRSSAACTRDTRESQWSGTSFVARRPIVTRSPAVPRSTQHLIGRVCPVGEERCAAALGRDAGAQLLGAREVWVER